MTVLFVLAALAFTSAATVQVGELHRRRAAEDELIFIGAQFRQALRSWHEAAPAGRAPRGPLRAEDLLLDPRFAQPQRHLRHLPPDPMTGRADWVLLRARDGGIVGLHSASSRRPVRQANFPSDFFHFEHRGRYRDWWFTWGLICTAGGCTLDDTTTAP